MVCIYKITSPSGKIYIGQTKNLKRRIYNYQIHHCKNQVKLYNSLVKYGWENHSIKVIEKFTGDFSQKDLDEKEKQYINQYKEEGLDLMNLKDGGGVSSHSAESKLKMSNKRKAFHKNNPEVSLKFSKKISQFDSKNNLVATWKSVRFAAQSLGIKRETLTSHLKKSKEVLGFVFKYEQ